MHLHCTMHPTTGAMTVTPPLQPLDIHFDYQSELAAISTVIDQMKQQRLTVATQQLPLVTPTMPTPSNEMDLLNAEQHLEAVLLEYPRLIDLDNDNPTPAPQLALPSLTAMFALQTKVLCTMTMILGKIINSIDQFLATRNCPSHSPKSSCPPPAPTIPGPTLTLPCLACHPLHGTLSQSTQNPSLCLGSLLAIRLPKQNQSLSQSSTLQKLSLAKPPFICSCNKMEPVCHKDCLCPLVLSILHSIMINQHQCGSSSMI